MKTMLTSMMIIAAALSSEAQSLLSSPFRPAASKHFYLFGSTAINTTDQLISSLQGSQKFLGTFILKPQDEGWGALGIDATVGINALNLKPNNVDKDSIDINSLIFPETGNFGFMFTPTLHYYRSSDQNATYRVSAEASIALRQNAATLNTRDSAGNIVSSENAEFSVLNWNVMPVKFTYIYHPADDADFEAIFSMGVYYHFFNIPNEDAKNFNKLFPVTDPVFLNSKGSSIHSLGCKFSISINKFMFYTDMRHNFSNTNIASNNPLTGFVFNAGFATNFIVFSK